MTAQEQAQEIVRTYCPQPGSLNQRALIEAIRRAIIQADVAKRQPPELTASQAGSIVYQILFFVDEWARALNAAEYPDQANALADCRRKVLAIMQAPRKPVLREVGGTRARAKGAGA